MSHRPLDVEFGLPMSPQIRTGPIKKIWTLKLENKKMRTCYVASIFFFLKYSLIRNFWQQCKTLSPKHSGIHVWLAKILISQAFIMLFCLAHFPLFYIPNSKMLKSPWAFWNIFGDNIWRFEIFHTNSPCLQPNRPLRWSSPSTN